MESHEAHQVPDDQQIKGTDFTEKKDTFARELRKLSCIAMPMIVVSVMQFMVQMVLMMMLGHVSELALSSACTATSFANVMGYSLMVGLACGLETLCGQAYGAKQYKKLGTYTYGAIIWLFVACLPVCVLWSYTDKLLVLIHQDPAISEEAGKFTIWLIPSLFSYAVLQCLCRYLQTQSLILPMLLSSLASLCIQMPVSWAFILSLHLQPVH